MISDHYCPGHSAMNFFSNDQDSLSAMKAPALTFRPCRTSGSSRIGALPVTCLRVYRRATVDDFDFPTCFDERHRLRR
jgi:hypothetical protein